MCRSIRVFSSIHYTVSNRYYDSCSLMSPSTTAILVDRSHWLAGLKAYIYNQCRDQIQMIIKRQSKVGRSNGASGNGDGGGLQTDFSSPCHTSAQLLMAALMS